ncbi:fumarate/nitrate reduction transcriptional regulator Fnr [Parendozoicomonas haliclonae]|uniref:Transcriptional activator protein Anr n=1 Tax=Parendozoicomonas haliclonae TaxID=1960125 RepID=A0A1X7AI09_9GAMM|nr:fumarate/nitrate reduction transcriptional regulator Fnr [Parendozoicomonas haliclonae]SMA43618.1 Transcriptional activator protein Anr [Parendozoicomonas haliclonae]
MASKLNVRHASQVACRDCSLSPLCLPLALKIEDIDELDEIIKRGRPLKKGEHLFLEGDPFHSVFAVRSGALKTYTSTNEGEEQITGFYLPSELVGLSGLDTDAYPVSAQAIETTMVCEIPFEKLEKLADTHPALRRQLMRVMSKKIREDQQMKLLLSKKNADERIATFLINLASRFRRRGFSSQSFRLAMSRNEMGNYLGLAVETVSRVFTRFQKAELIHANGKEIEITNAMELCTLAGGKLTENSEAVNIQ